MIKMLLYENKYFVEKIEIRKNMLKDLTVSLTKLVSIEMLNIFYKSIAYYVLGDVYLTKLVSWKYEYFLKINRILRIRKCLLNEVSFYRNVNIFYKSIAYYVLGDVYLTKLVSWKYEYFLKIYRILRIRRCLLNEVSFTEI